MARDAGGADLGITEAVADGAIAGPRLQVSISMLSQTGGHWYPSGAKVPFMGPHPGRPSGIVDGVDEVRRKVRELRRDGADVIKVATWGGVLSARDDPRHAHFRPAELEALVEGASAAGMLVMAHAQGADEIENAVRAGIRSRMVIDIHRAAFRRAVEAGVRIAMGTDDGRRPGPGHDRRRQAGRLRGRRRRSVRLHGPRRPGSSRSGRAAREWSEPSCGRGRAASRRGLRSGPSERDDSAIPTDPRFRHARDRPS